MILVLLHWLQYLLDILFDFLAKENVPEIPQTGLAVLQQQFVLAQSIETWIEELKQKYE